MENICIQYHKTKIGELILGSFKEKLCLLDFNFRKMRNAVDDRIKKGLNAEFKEEDSDIIEKTRTELEEYFQGDSSGTCCGCDACCRRRASANTGPGSNCDGSSGIGNHIG